MSKRYGLVAILFAILAAGCTTIPDYFSGLGGLTSTEKKFVKLAFSDFLNGTGKRKLIYKPNVYVYVHGNAASSFRRDVKADLDILNTSFHVQLVDDASAADIDLYLYRSDGSLGKIGAYTEALNYRNRYPIRAFGKQLIFNSDGTMKGVGDARRPYPPGYFKPETFHKKRYFRPCAGAFYESTLDKQLKIFWPRKTWWGSRPHPWISERPDKAVFHVFAGFYGPDAAKAYREIGVSADQVTRLAKSCLLEELGHAVTLWSDVDEDGIFEKHGPKIEASSRAEELELSLKHREGDEAELRELLAIYRRPRIRDGLTKAEVIEILKND